MNRTVTEFVEELVAEGRGAQYIRTVAQNCRWKNCMNEVRVAYRKTIKRIKKIKSRK